MNLDQISMEIGTDVCKCTKISAYWSTCLLFYGRFCKVRKKEAKEEKVKKYLKLDTSYLRDIFGNFFQIWTPLPGRHLYSKFSSNPWSTVDEWF